IDRIAAEMGGKPAVIATGGLAELFGGGSQRISEVDPLLTLKGLRLIDERNRGQEGLLRRRRGRVHPATRHSVSPLSQGFRAAQGVEGARRPARGGRGRGRGGGRPTRGAPRGREREPAFPFRLRR